MIPGGDWHTDYCAKDDTFDFAGEPISTPCDCGWEDALVRIEAEARAAVLRELREEVADLSGWLSTCRCFVINPKFGEGQPGGHFTDCAWAHESDVRDEILAAIDRRLGG